MANIIKIKRGEGADAPSALARGEFGFSEGSSGAALNLHIGWGAETSGAAANITRIGSNFGIGDTDAVKIDGADIATGEYAKFTANGLQSKTPGEVLGDIGADAAGTDNSTNVSLAGSYDYITAGGTGNQTLTLGQVNLTTDVTGVLPAANVVALNVITSPAGNVSMTTGSTAYKITGLAAPTSPNDAARKADVDTAVQGLDVRDSVRVISVVDLPAGNIASNSGAYTIDSVPLVATDRVLLQNQTPPSENGIYVVNTPSGSTHSMTRAADANHADDLSANMFFFVEEGTVYADTGWVCTTNETLSLTNMLFAQFSGTGSYTAGGGLDLTGTEFGIADEGVTLAKMADVTANTVIGRLTDGGVPTLLSAANVLTMIGVVTGAQVNVKADWTQATSSHDAYVQNKPALGGAALLDVGTDNDEVCAGDDSRLSDSRTPTTHSHAVGTGGTGLNTLLDGAVMLGNGTNAVTMLAKVAAGQLLTSGGTAGGDEALWSASLSGITIDCGTF